MDFLEIRRKAKERAAARAAAGAGAGPASAPEGAGMPAGAARLPLALDPLPLPDPDPVSLSPMPGPEEEPVLQPTPGPQPAEPLFSTEPAPPDPEAERRAMEAAAEAVRLEEELEARLREMPSAPDGRFLTWRPTGGSASELEPIAPEPEEVAEPVRREERRQGVQAARRRGADGAHGAAPVGDPLDEFFYREGESGPDLGVVASPVEAAPAPAEVLERIEYLTFLLGSEEYGVEIERVREVMRSPPITEVPRAPPDVLGVITVRGEVVAVFDPRGRLGLPRGAPAAGGRVIIVDDGAGPCGLLVDAVASVVRLPRGSIEPCPQGIGGASADCLEGIGRDHDRLFTVLSVPALLKPGRRLEGRG